MTMTELSLVISGIAIGLSLANFMLILHTRMRD